MAEGDQGNQHGAGEQGQGGGQGAQESLGWRAGLPGEFRDHAWAKEFTKVGDFFRAALTSKEEADGLKGKLAGAIFKPNDKATPEETAAYRKAMGVPDKPTEYELPTVEGLEQSPEMVQWAQKVFHDCGLSKDQGAAIGKSWNQFVAAMVKAEDEAEARARTDAEAALRKELGSDDKYKEAVELTRRLLKEQATTEELAFLDESGAGNHPLMIRLITRLASKTGEDTSPRGSGSGTTQVKGIVYDKSPSPPQKVY